MVATPGETSCDNLLVPENPADWFGFELKFKLKAESNGYWKHLIGTYKEEPVFPVITTYGYKVKKNEDGTE